MLELAAPARIRAFSDWGIEVKLSCRTLCFVSFTWATHFSSRPAQGPPHEGLRKARRLNLLHDLAGMCLTGSRLPTRSPCPSSPGKM
jgi:hypothetical protein